ncbi:MAG: aldehyde dehydrogenase family protein, partial [Candidatus Hydrogenedentes bacterium]|nr:aldehyde dehydrogenase family protein [Candidatus Hydrogenedentota bacterium]
MRYRIDKPNNDPVRSYAPNSPERDSLKAKLNSMLKEQIEIPLIIGGKEYRTGLLKECVCPHDHGRVLAKYHLADSKHVQLAIDAALKARKDWAALPWEHRVSVLLKMAELLAGPYRDVINAATMLNQSKTVYQAEIDAACELVDFYKFNAYYYTQILSEHPNSAPGMWNSL